MPEKLNSTLGTFEHDNLFAGSSEVVRDTLTLKSGQVYVRGTVLGLGDDNKATLVDSTAEGNEKAPFAILADNVDATEEDRPADVYLTGEFNENALVFGGSDTVETHKQALRNIGIFLKTNQES